MANTVIAIVGCGFLIAVMVSPVCGNQDELPKHFEAKPLLETNSHSRVAGAFGWNLGDKLPTNILVKTDSHGFGLYYHFIPDTPAPPFDVYTLHLLADRSIAEIEAEMTHFDSFEVEKTKEPMVEFLTEKYGLRSKSHIAQGLDLDTYHFGSEERGVDLVYSEPLHEFMLTYFDRSLQRKWESEFRQSEEAVKNSAKDTMKDSGL